MQRLFILCVLLADYLFWLNCCVSLCLLFDVVACGCLVLGSLFAMRAGLRSIGGLMGWALLFRV